MQAGRGQNARKQDKQARRQRPRWESEETCNSRAVLGKGLMIFQLKSMKFYFYNGLCHKAALQKDINYTFEMFP